MCDFSPSCSDGSDEAVCGTCDFEKGGCGWVNDESADFFWAYSMASTYTWYNKPANDHTFGNKTGTSIRYKLFRQNVPIVITFLTQH